MPSGSGPVDAESADRPVWWRRRRVIIPALAALIVLIVVVAAVVTFSGGEPADTVATDASADPGVSQEFRESPSASPSPSVSPSSVAPTSAQPSASRTTSAGAGAGTGGRTTLAAVGSFVLKIQGYDATTLPALVKAPQPLIIVDLAHDAHTDWFTAAELASLHAAGKTVLSYFEIGAIEDNRPEYPVIRAQAPDLILNQWPSWPHEYFAKYWDTRWWDLAVRPRVDQAVKAGFDGVYLDTPLAYAELDLSMAPGETRDTLGRKMVDQIVKLSSYAKGKKAGMLVFPQNSPELRSYSGYLGAIDGIGMESMFFAPTDKPCDMDWCPTNLNEARAVKAAGKTVLAIDYAVQPANIASACAKYRQYGFAGYVTTLEVNRISPSC